MNQIADKVQIETPVIEESIKLRNEINQAFKSINFNVRKDSLELLYKQLLTKDNRTNDEELIFQVLCFQERIFIEQEERMSQLHKKINYPHRNMYLDWNGKTIKMWEFTIKSFYCDKHVACEVVNGWRVSTVWLGLNHSWLENSLPLIFETMIFKEDDNSVNIEELSNYQERYSTLQEAEYGHKKACEAVRYYTTDC